MREQYRSGGRVLVRASEAMTHLSNAIRFTPDGGRVEVFARERDSHLEIEVVDQGPGIPDDRIVHLFDHGYSIHDPLRHHSSQDLEFNSRGLGLGLGITRGIVEAHGGTVSVRNVDTGGSLFLIRIPRVEGLRAAG